MVGFFTVIINEYVVGHRRPPYVKLLLVVGICTWVNDILVAAGLALCMYTRKKNPEFSE